MNKKEPLRKRIYKKILFGLVFPAFYRFLSRRKVQDGLALFIEVRYEKPSGNFTLLEQALAAEGMECAWCFLGKSYVSGAEYLKRCFAMLCKLSVSRYAFLNEGCNVIGALPLRKETKIVQTWHGCGAFKKFGYSVSGSLPPGYYGNCAFVTVSSRQVAGIYRAAMGLKKKQVRPTGVSRTDVFFQEAFLRKAEEKYREFEEKSVAKKGRKRILYAPTFRGDATGAVSAKLPDLLLLYEELKDDYIILYQEHPAVAGKARIDRAYRDFFVDVSGKLTIQELIAVCGLCVTDYSSVVFEFSLMGRPMVFYAPDYEEYVDERGFYFPYGEFVPGPVCRTTQELLTGIRQADGQDLERVQEFRDRFMGSCDGHATQRIIRMLKAEETKKQ